MEAVSFRDGCGDGESERNVIERGALGGRETRVGETGGELFIDKRMVFGKSGRLSHVEPGVEAVQEGSSMRTMLPIALLNLLARFQLK